jgi:hydrogenase nickel incorporation protein HypA/HybF
MHEYHMVERLVWQAVEAAKEKKASRITRIALAVSARAGINPESVRLHFPQAAKGTIAESAELDIKVIEGSGEKDCPALYIEDIEVEA